ncbi:ABC transporter substrate-binding protein [Brevibacillus dissolubilis]|uniref:ABC transporter substrate-binding protein n=1 Tax=Brevibacillus dissolubilis TaxID=1844116 RepID=UPI0011176FA1|nr:ABC transporter substrate-binding protein [Brevibacillus dissolubilis]
MKKRTLGTALTSVLALSMVLTGCGGNSAEPANSTKEQPAQETKSGDKTIIVGRGGDSVGLDPIRETDGESAKVTENIFDTLVSYEETSTKVIPGLAESWEVSPDGLTYTFKLRQGVKFHDGTDFNAEAVVFNFNRWMDKSNPLYDKEGFEYYNDMFGGYKGDKDHVIASVTAKDANTVEIKLSRPQAPFLQNLAMWCFAIASPDALKKYGEKFTENPVGTGPFKFVEWKRNDSITLEKNPNYWNQGFPKLDKVIFKTIPENSARLTALQAGEIDLMDGLNPEDVKTVEENADLQLFKRPSMNVGYLGFNVEKKPFDNPKVRQAIGHAINKQGLVDAFYAGLGEPATNPMPPSLWGFNDQIKDREYNLDKAKQLLAEAGFPNGFQTTFWAMPVPRPYIPDGPKMAEAMQQDFKKIGIDAKIVTMEWATYLDKTKVGEQDMFMLGWTGDNGDPDNFLSVFFNKNNIGGNNRSRYANDELQGILMKAQAEPDQAKREEMYKKAQEIVFNEVPLIPLVHSTPPLAGKKGITGYVPHPKGSESLEKVDIQ